MITSDSPNQSSSKTAVEERDSPKWEPTDLPPLIRPDGNGYMPLFSVAHWIATYGGTQELNPKDEDLWPRTYGELVDAICSGKVRVVGRRIGTTSGGLPLAPETFAGCAVQYPYPIEDFDWTFADDELVLRSFPYDDDDDWRHGFSDALIDRDGQGWSRLMALNSDVRSVWPFGTTAPSKTGVSGRPPSVYLAQNEFRRRAAQRDIENTLKAEGDFLESWFRATYPDEKPVKSTSIQNTIRSDYREAIKLKKGRI